MNNLIIGYKEEENLTKHKMGNFYKHRNNDIYILAITSCKGCNLIRLIDGARYDINNILLDQIDSYFANKKFFTRIPNNTEITLKVNRD